MRTLGLLLIAMSVGAADLDQVRRDFENPPVEVRPHTRWWWMGNALRAGDITYQLDQMKSQGIGGVEQISMGPVFEKGNVEFLSAEYFELLKHAVREAKTRGMEFSLNFGGPGWIWGGEWVPREYRNRSMVASAVEVEGPRVFKGELPVEVEQNPRNRTQSLVRVRAEDEVVAVVAGKVADGRMEAATLRELTGEVRGRRVRWTVPAGRWRLMAFWSVVQAEPAVDHLSRAAMEHYCEYVGSRFQAAVGGEFGKTVESVFMDSFEVPVFRNGLYWTPRFPELFESRRGYGLKRWLPALWWEVDALSPKIRYDVNRTLHEVGMNAFFDVFTGWARRHGVKARIQPYGFVTDILEGAGASDIPEMEITAGEKDAVPWFDTRIGPRIYTASGARLYGRRPISVEAYTYLHWEQGRDTLEELKIASDAFLRAGATKFYNHGYTGTPEREFAASRRFGAEMLLSDVNVWWRYYGRLSDYVARVSAVLRHGRHVADVAVYSPLANQWTRDVLNARRWTRDFEWGDLGKLLLANGYDFDLINDDVLQRRADLSGGRIRVADQSYRVLVLPNIEAMPVETLRRVAEFARGGGVVIATDRLPAASTGLAEHAKNDAAVRALASELFAKESHGEGRALLVKQVIDRPNVLDRPASLFDPFVNALRRFVEPDFAIDFAREGIRENNGLVATHQSTEDSEIYFVANMQDRAVDTRVKFRVAGRGVEVWDAVTGERRRLWEYEEKDGATHVPVRLAAWESAIYVFSGKPGEHVRRSDFAEVVGEGRALASRNGGHEVDGRMVRVEGIPAPLQVAGAWKMKVGEVEKTVTRLASWTAEEATRRFSGTGVYETEFELPVAYAGEGLRLWLSLGDVGNVGEVEVNGRAAGVVWMSGQKLEVTGLVKTGTNRLKVSVTNTLINRASGWKKAPPLAPELVERYGRGIQDDDAQYRRLYGFEPLPRSGLLGPVEITARKEVRIR